MVPLCTPLPKTETLESFSFSTLPPTKLSHLMYLGNSQVLPVLPPKCLWNLPSTPFPTATTLTQAMLNIALDSCQTTYLVSLPPVLHHDPFLSILDTVGKILQLSTDPRVKSEVLNLP